MPAVSVILPVFNEQQLINGVIDQLKLQGVEEIIVVDGSPDVSTLAVITDPAVIRCTSPKGRGSQLAAGVSAAAGEVILMLHADTRLPHNAMLSVSAAVTDGAAWGAFRLGIEAPGFVYRIIERVVDLRCKLFALPYGDQAIFVTRAALMQIGGIPPIPLMEDVALARKLHRTGHSLLLLPQRVATSPRRWQKDGIIRRTLKNWWLLLRYLTGTSPDSLSQEYR